MLKVIFVPESDSFDSAAKLYAGIWKNEGSKITAAIELAASSKFKERHIEAMVFEGVSQSHPLKLRASYDEDTKKATLVHELLHIISAEYAWRVPSKDDNLSLGLHKQINLLLYDIWTNLYGQQFADEQVRIESERTPYYKEAWSWALNFSKPERQSEFTKLCQPRYAKAVWR